ncbi:MAG: hypothetical protein DWQ07_16895 [Chloroflexi bacterium]|nr:MAG: hypothetical protein DWQ07_16895 [Chloroflexota bacterium]MBL1195082.1 hypothetical protein [Chloroflexota bacterium]NOH12369.1 hypothetical protein [Chloroflexota bacterium]
MENPGVSSRKIVWIVGAIAFLTVLIFVYFNLPDASPPSTQAIPTPLNAILWSDAISYTGKIKTVCGMIVGIRVHENPHDLDDDPLPVSLDMGNEYPTKDRFSIIFYPNVQQAYGFEPGIRSYIDNEICITGFISRFGEIPQIEVDSSTEISIFPSSF